MEQIKIGNDIKLQFSLANSPWYLQKNIKKLSCFLVNTTEFNDLCNCTCGGYLLDVCGMRSYHVLPRHHKFHGFMCDRDFQRYYPPCVFDDMTKYLAESDIDLKNDIINIYFPAKHQICGIYNVVIVAESYVPGWGKCELKTSTIYQNKVFEIVQNDGEAGDDITIVINPCDNTGCNPYDHSGYISFLPIRPFDKEHEDPKNGFCRTDDAFESADQEKYAQIGIDNIDVESMKKVSDLTQLTNVVNYTDGYYLWIVSKNPIKEVLANSFKIPTTSAIYNKKNKLYYYSSSNPINANYNIDGVDINVKFK